MTVTEPSTATPTTAGHIGGAELPTAFVNDESAPREYELSVAQTVLRVHNRVAGLFTERSEQPPGAALRRIHQPPGPGDDPTAPAHPMARHDH